MLLAHTSRPTASPCLQQVCASIVLWLRTRWVYQREAQHLRDVQLHLAEEDSEASAALLASPLTALDMAPAAIDTAD